MKQIVNLKLASTIKGLSQWELRTGALNGKYPFMRSGGNRGRILFDIEMLYMRIDTLMQLNMKQ